MPEPDNKVAAYEDLFGLPDNVVGEILEGELVTHPRPSPKHALAASMMGAELIREFGSRAAGSSGDWWILFEPECHLNGEIFVPDIAGWRKENMSELPDTAWFSVRPDWICEIISPSTAKYDRGVKQEIYAREGVPHYWIVDPMARTVEVFALGDISWTQLGLVSEDEVVNLAPFESMPFDLSMLWA